MSHNAAQDIMILLKRKYNLVEKIYCYTLDMEISVSQKDPETIAILLSLRSGLMADIESLDEKIEEKSCSLTALERLRIKAQMSENSIISEVSFEEAKINEIWLSARILLGKIIASDEKLKLKIEAISKLSSIDSV